MIEKLTKNQRASLSIIREKWLNKLFKNDTTEINRELFEKQINWLHEFCNVDSPQIIIYLDSPFACQIACNILSQILPDGAQVGDQVGAQVLDQVRNQIWDQIMVQFGNQIIVQVRDQVEAEVGDQVGAEVRAQVMNQVGDQIMEQTIGQIIGQIKGQKLKYYAFASYGNISDYPWVAFYDYYQHIKILKNENFDQFKLLLESNVYDYIDFGKIVIVSAKPIAIYRDNNNLLHNTNNAAIEFADGYKLYAIHGHFLPAWIWEKKNKITKETFLHTKNAEIAAGIYHVLGEKRMMEILEACEIDKQIIQHKNDEVEIIKLYKTKEIVKITDNISNYLAWVKFICPSTGTEYLIPVDAHHTNALDAAVSLSIFKKEEYSFNYRT